MTICTAAQRSLIHEWLSASDDTLREMSFDDVTLETIFQFLADAHCDIELLKLITKKLYELYQSGDDRLRLFTLCFIPALIAVYIGAMHRCNYPPQSGAIATATLDAHRRTDYDSLAILLLSVYNCEIVEPSPDAIDGARLRTIEIRVVTLAKPSIYHEPNSHTQLGTPAAGVPPTEHALARMNAAAASADSRISIFGPYEAAESLVAANYQSICAVLLKVYNQHISEMGDCSLAALCHAFDRLLRLGQSSNDLPPPIDLRQKINDYLHHSPRSGSGAGGSSGGGGLTDLASIVQQVRQRQHHQSGSSAAPLPPTAATTSRPILPLHCIPIQFSAFFLVELTRSIYHCVYNELTEAIAFDVLDRIAARATLHLNTDVLLMINAIKNSIAIKQQRDRMLMGTTAAATAATKGANGVAPGVAANMASCSISSSLNSFASVTSGIVPVESRWQSVRKNAITNASFKARKLPDDIPIRQMPTSGGGGGASGGSGSAGMGATSSPHSQSALAEMARKQMLGAIGTPPAASAAAAASTGTPSPHPRLISTNSVSSGGGGKNLDSIDEECSERLLGAAGAGAGAGSSGDGSGEPSPAPKKSSGSGGGSSKISVKNLLKELKEKPNKQSKASSSHHHQQHRTGSAENGKLGSSGKKSSSGTNQQPHAHPHHNLNNSISSIDHDSDTSIISESCGKMSNIDEPPTGDTMAENIPMRRLNKYIDEEDEDGEQAQQQEQQEREENGPRNDHVDDEDRSKSSQKVEDRERISANNNDILGHTPTRLLRGPPSHLANGSA